MPTLSVIATQTTELELKPSLKRKLLQEMAAHSALQEQIKVLETKKSYHNKQVQNILFETGESKLLIEGYAATLVAGVRKVLNKKKLSSSALAEVNAAMESVPSKPYTRITPPGAKEVDNADTD